MAISPPVPYAPELVESILDRIGDGESLSHICRDEGMPNKRTFLRWVTDKPEVQKLYTEALKLREEVYFDQIVDIVDTCRDPAKARLQADSRKWVLARMNPKKYGDKMTQELTGADGGPMVVEIMHFSGTPEEVAAAHAESRAQFDRVGEEIDRSFPEA